MDMTSVRGRGGQGEEEGASMQIRAETKYVFVVRGNLWPGNCPCGSNLRICAGRGKYRVEGGRGGGKRVWPMEGGLKH